MDSTVRAVLIAVAAGAQHIATLGSGIASAATAILSSLVYALGVAIPPGESPIVPIVVGGEQRALELSAELGRRGLAVPAIRPPTVPAGTSRLRISLSTTHTRDQIDRLVQELSALL